ncbi:MAG: metallophosphoesterase [Dysgonamonadaceae bacterium]|jgi:predicted MPP superfamily phosphohydrolase|nr:metallophosphoesterase [Dysgonamonadaceae bacterium]
MKFFITVFLIYTLVNGYIFYKGWKSLPALPMAKTAYSIVYGIFYSSFIFAMLGRNLLPLGIQKALYLPGTVWLGAMLYLTLWFVMTDGLYLLCRLIPSVKKRTRSLRFFRIQACTGYLLVFLVLANGYYRFVHPAVAEQTIDIHKSGGKYRNLKIVAFSDIHLGVAIDKKRLQSYIQLVNRQQPDLILIGGDVVDNNVLPLNLENMQEELNRLQAPLGVYMCLGNHEYLSGITPSLEFLKKTQIRVLIDEAIAIDNSFWLIGRDDTHGNPRRQPLKALLAQADAAQPLLLIDHEPWVIREAVENHIDWQFSGHTHYGQMWPLSYVVNRVFTIGYGYEKFGDTHIYVSSGLGLWGPPFRIGTQSEIVVFNLRFEE